MTPTRHTPLQGKAYLLLCLLILSPLHMRAQLPERTPENVKKYTVRCRQHSDCDMKVM